MQNCIIASQFSVNQRKRLTQILPLVSASYRLNFTRNGTSVVAYKMGLEYIYVCSYEPTLDKRGPACFS